MDISVVIPTCNRPDRLLALLECLSHSTHPLTEVIIVDSGDDKLNLAKHPHLQRLNLHFLESERSVCIQRNKGINHANSPWIFLCDDDIEVPADYLQKLADHIKQHPEAGAVSGQVLQKEDNEWKATYPETSAFQLTWKYVFGLSIWGPVECKSKNAIIQKIKKHFSKKGNYISKAGWPVLTDLNGAYFTTPVYGLGASLVKKQWLLKSPYDEVLDRHGIGDNYGVAIGFPGPVHIVSNAFVYHHQETVNRLARPKQYFRRALALDYFRRKNKDLPVKKQNMVWSLTGNFFLFLLKGNGLMSRAALKTLWWIAFKKNPYYIASLQNKKITEPGS